MSVSDRTDILATTVMLLGQAESGKSTLQKQFQLYYASQSLDRERPLWRPIVYSNILKALRMLMYELDRQYGSGTSITTPASTPGSISALAMNAPESPASSPPPEGGWPDDLAIIAPTLSPIIAHEDDLASELSGGIKVSGGRTGVYVRAGWQALITPNRAWPLTDIRDSADRPNAVTNLVGKTLWAAQRSIAEFWNHPTVRKLVSSNKVRLEESAALYVRD